MLGPTAARIARLSVPLSAKLQVSFLVLIVVLLATAGVSLHALADMREHAIQLDRLNGAVRVALGLDHSILVQEHLSSMFLLTSEEAYAGKLEAEHRRFRELLDRLPPDGTRADRVGRIAEAFGRFEAAARQVRALHRASAREPAERLHVAHEHAIAHEIEALTKAVVARLTALQAAQQAEILSAQRRANWTVAAFFLLSVVLALGLGSLLARSILDPLRRVGDALDRIAGGDFTVMADVPNRDELGALVTHVNGMSRRLADLYARERQAAQALQEQLATLERTQAQLRQAQKMEAVGRLAGGIAHDFNNLMTVIGGRAELMLGSLPPGHPARRDAELVTRTADRAAALTRQLLAFSRKQVLQPRVLEVDALVEGLAPVLQRLIGEHITLVTRLGAGRGRVKADPTQLEQVLLNLAVNARDAMPDGGRLTIETAPAAPGGVGAGLPPTGGPGVTLAVRDTGVGMDAEVRSHIFEPFFTTKGPGQGTGLGLAMVYGIVSQSGGLIAVDSEVGRGTAVTIWLPCVEEPAPPAPADERAHDPLPGGETVLLVEDEPDVRQFAREVLERHGYTVLCAADGEEALTVERAAGVALELLVTDVVMPRRGGPDLAREVAARRPGLKVLYMSGYADAALGPGYALPPDARLLPKPFTPDQLARAVRGVLGPPGPVA
jgi:signal transduction histidine kinase/CheY-like chemotaxis protein